VVPDDHAWRAGLGDQPAEGRTPMAQFELLIFDWRRGQSEVRLRLPTDGQVERELQSANSEQIRKICARLARVATRELRDLVNIVAEARAGMASQDTLEP